MSHEDVQSSGARKIRRVEIGPHFEMHPVVFPVAASIVVLLVATCFAFPKGSLETTFVNVRDSISRNFGWLYVSLMTGFLVFAAWLAFGRYGHVVLGPDDAKPEFRRVSWFAMLFGAGMGIGLLFFSVGEPISHFTSPPPGFDGDWKQNRLAMATTIFHWGLHPWALYACVSLALAYYGFRMNMPLSFRSLLYPIFGDRVWGGLGDVVDTLAVISTLVGVATSLGIGAQQVNAGLTFLLGVPAGTATQVCLIGAITALATISVVSGLDGGIRRLSEANLLMAVTLMLLIACGGGILAFLAATYRNTWAYLQVLPLNSVRSGLIDTEARTWISGWTVFYWAWWISWSPFVGMFIARVSKGRTIREFIMGVLLAPTCACIVWLTAFGSTALRQHAEHNAQPEAQADSTQVNELPEYWVAEENSQGETIRLDDGSMARSLQPLTAVEYYSAPIVTESGKERIETLPTVLFTLIEGLFQSRTAIVAAATIATICIILFFVTSSDSASMVIDIIASGGNPDPPVLTRLFWALSEGLVAAMLLVAGGLKALQAASVAAALPLTIVLVLMVCGLIRALFKNEQDPSKNENVPASIE